MIMGFSSTTATGRWTRPKHIERAGSRADREATSELERHVFFATPVVDEPEEEMMREFPLYEALAKSLEHQKIGSYLPHKQMPRGYSSDEAIIAAHEAIGKSKVLVADIGTYSTGGLVFIQMALQSGKPFVSFYRADAKRFLQGVLRIAPVVVYQDQQGIDDVVAIVKAEYPRAS